MTKLIISYIKISALIYLLSLIFFFFFKFNFFFFLKKLKIKIINFLKRLKE